MERGVIMPTVVIVNVLFSLSEQDGGKDADDHIMIIAIGGAGGEH